MNRPNFRFTSGTGRSLIAGRVFNVAKRCTVKNGKRVPGVRSGATESVTQSYQCRTQTSGMQITEDQAHEAAENSLISRNRESNVRNIFQSGSQFIVFRER